MDPIDKMKAAAREAWATFTPFEMITGTAAPELVRLAGVTAGQQVLDVGCGTGVVALTAARAGAHVIGADLAPALLERARENASIANLAVTFQEADVEALPFDDGQFDIVLSQFGHMFGPRPEITVSEMLRVLKPGGTIAFSTWPPELFTGGMFSLVGRYSPPPPQGASPPAAWGDISTIGQRLGDNVRGLRFDRACMRFPTLSPAHMRLFIESNIGPVARVVSLLADEPQKLAEFRAEFELLIGQYFEHNIVRQDYVMTRAEKV